MGQIHLRIADLRRQKKVTQQELADRVGVSYQTVSRWETGAGSRSCLWWRRWRSIFRCRWISCWD